MTSVLTNGNEIKEVEVQNICREKDKQKDNHKETERSRKYINLWDTEDRKKGKIIAKRQIDQENKLSCEKLRKERGKRLEKETLNN
jgi:hypothetical protein